MTEKVLYVVCEDRSGEEDDYWGRSIELSMEDDAVHLFVGQEWLGDAYDYTVIPLRLKKSEIKELIAGLQKALEEISHDA